MQLTLIDACLGVLKLICAQSCPSSVQGSFDEHCGTGTRIGGGRPAAATYQIHIELAMERGPNDTVWLHWAHKCYNELGGPPQISWPI
jgi:hypothetical protein